MSTYIVGLCVLTLISLVIIGIIVFPDQPGRRKWGKRSRQ